MHLPSLHHLAAAAALALCAAAQAAPDISRLTPPSNPPAAGAATLARFLPGQKFDLQATVQPEPGRRIARVSFAIDGREVAVIRHDGSAADQFLGRTGLAKGGFVKGLAEGSVVASLRGYSHARPGLHALRVTAVDSSGASSTRSGSFEIVALAAGNGRPAKNIIFMLGDGMGIAHRTAARIVSRGYLQGKAQGRLAMDSFPYTGLVMTASLNGIVTDSAPGMSNYVTGNKANNDQEGVFPDDTEAAFDNPRIEYLSEYLHRTRGTALGIVTTADVFDATPAANAVHTSARGKGTGIVDQFLDDRHLTGLKVLMGGGRKWFLPQNAAQTAGTEAAARTFNAKPPGLEAVANGSARKAELDYALGADIVAGWGAAPGKAGDVDRDLIADFQSAGFTYVADRRALDAAQADGAPRALLGLFALSNMNVAFDKIAGRRGNSSVVADYGFPDQPLLPEMTEAALRVLQRDNRKGFVLLVEGASIDKQAHLMDSDRWILETIEFDQAVQKAKDFAAAHPDTLVVVTADHECSGAAIIGASLVGDAELRAKAPTPAAMRDEVVGNYEHAGFPRYEIAADGFPRSTDIDRKMLIGYGANADRHEAWVSNERPTQDGQQPFAGVAPLGAYPAQPQARQVERGVLITGQVKGTQAVHTATDVPLSAYGRGASLFTGVFDNTDVFFKLGQAALRGAK